VKICGIASAYFQSGCRRSESEARTFRALLRTLPGVRAIAWSERRSRRPQTINPHTLRARMRKLGIDAPTFRGAI
jgi:hypothetical protein